MRQQAARAARPADAATGLAARRLHHDKLGRHPAAFVAVCHLAVTARSVVARVRLSHKGMQSVQVHVVVLLRGLRRTAPPRVAGARFRALRRGVVCLGLYSGVLVAARVVP